MFTQQDRLDKDVQLCIAPSIFLKKITPMGSLEDFFVIILVFWKSINYDCFPPNPRAPCDSYLSILSMTVCFHWSSVVSCTLEVYYEVPPFYFFGNFSPCSLEEDQEILPSFSFQNLVER
mmetsp:Transcript_8974/g.13514  ORF Transcript_8974/g.13514 Transcript_8974/m.13514 type:complete len:120 (-) Transcript_8974:615-974(-)